MPELLQSLSSAEIYSVSLIAWLVENNAALLIWRFALYGGGYYYAVRSLELHVFKPGYAGDRARVKKTVLQVVCAAAVLIEAAVVATSV